MNCFSEHFFFLTAPTECAKHEVMCLDGSKCIKPGHICDWKYNCLDRSDEVGCGK